MTADDQQPAKPVPAWHLESGAEIRAMRGHVGMTQAQLSAAVGVTPQYLGQVERGQKGISKTLEGALLWAFYSFLHCIPNRHLPAPKSKAPSWLK